MGSEQDWGKLRLGKHVHGCPFLLALCRYHGNPRLVEPLVPRVGWGTCRTKTQVPRWAETRQDQPSSRQISDSQGSPSKIHRTSWLPEEARNLSILVSCIFIFAISKCFYVHLRPLWLLYHLEACYLLIKYRGFPSYFSVTYLKFNSTLLWNHSLYDYYTSKFVELCYMAQYGVYLHECSMWALE